MAIFPSTPSLRTRVLPRFPANVIAGNGITITKSGGTYVFALAPIDDLPLTSLQDVPTDTLLGRDSNGNGPVEVVSVSGGLGFTGSGQLQMTDNQRVRGLPFQLGGAGVAITPGVKGDMFVPFSCVITRVTLLADLAPVGTAFVLDIWKDTYANYPPTGADTITAALKPTVSIGAFKGQTGDISTWTTNLAAGDVLRFNVDTTATATRVYVGIDVTTV